MKCRQFSGEAQHNPLPAFILVMLALLALVAMSSLLVLRYLLIKDQVSPHSTLTLRFRLSFNFNNSRAGQNTCKKGKTKSDKALNGPFFKDMILLGGPDHEKVPGKEHGYGLCKMAMLLQLLLFLRSGMRKICMIFFIRYFPASCEWLTMFR